MLQVSKLADYATIVMVYLAHHPTEVHNAKDIATHIHLSVPTVSKLLKLLSNAQLLVSQRGVKGGYTLSRSADSISVAQIIQAVEGQQGLTQCSHTAGECILEPVCSIRRNWNLISQAVTFALESVSLADLAAPALNVARVDVSRIQALRRS